MVPPFGNSFVAINPAPPASPDDATKQALLAVVQVWLDRLQSMAVVTTFFVSIDSMLYSYPARDPDSESWSATDTLIIASLGGAIILHVCASILAYCGSFVLIRYRLNDAEKQEEATEHPTVATNLNGQDNKELHTHPLSTGATMSSTAKSPTEYVRDISWDAYMDLRSLISVHQIQPFACLCYGGRKANPKKDPEASVSDDAVTSLRSMVRMLTRVHTATAIMAVFGFILALLGTLAYFWTGLPRALGIFASACLGGCMLAGAIAVF